MYKLHNVHRTSASCQRRKRVNDFARLLRVRETIDPVKPTNAVRVTPVLMSEPHYQPCSSARLSVRLSPKSKQRRKTRIRTNVLQDRSSKFIGKYHASDDALCKICILFIYLFIYYMVYTHVKSFTIVKNRKCGQVTSHCRKARPYRADLSLF